MPKLIKNVIPKRWRFALHFTDGRTEEVTVEAESYHVAIYALPRFADVGRYRYEPLRGGSK
jgi:hypothetical protein